MKADLEIVDDLGENKGQCDLKVKVLGNSEGDHEVDGRGRGKSTMARAMGGELMIEDDLEVVVDDDHG